MILIRDIKIEEVQPDDFYPLYHYGPDMLLARDLLNPVKEVIVTREMVKGQRFRNIRGLEVVIGWDKTSQVALGLPFKVFEAQERRRESDYRENAKLRKRVRELENMTVFQFIKRLFRLEGS